ncbi:MAG: choice-of-anchor P family protein [Sporichthyaceae bacterium]
MKRPSKSHLAIGLAASTVAMTFGLAPQSNAATPFADGGFENPPVAGPFQTFNAGAALGAWTVASGSVDLIGTFWDGAGAGADQSIDLNGNTAGKLCQTTATSPGSTYRLDYAMSKNAGTNTATMDVTVGAFSKSETYNQNNSNANMMWSARSAEFTAAAATSEICFASTFPAGGGSGPALDEVSLTLVNTPPTATIDAPAAGQIYFQGEQANLAFSCDDVDDNLTSCLADNGQDSGDAVDTDTAGDYVLGVEATDAEGATGSASAAYTVKPLNTACHSVGILLPGTRISDANPERTPCETRKSTQVENDTIPLLIGSLSYQALSAVTQNDGTGMMGAATTAAKVNLNLLGLQIGVENLVSAVQAQMLPGCAGVDSFGQSRAGRITILGQTYDIGTASRTITLPLGLGAVYINQQVKTANTITQRAVFVDLPGTFLDVAIGQVGVGVSCDGPVTVANAVREDAKPSRGEVEELRTRLEKVESAEA